MQLKLSLLLLLFCSSSLLGFSHDYYFGFAEMSYSETNKTLETTIILAEHDFENILLKAQKINKSLEYLEKDSLTIRIVEQEILKNFSVSNAKDSIPFHFESIGFQVMPNGLIQIYLLAKNVEPFSALNITFACLMEQFPDQQNKMTFIKKRKKFTAVFLPSRPTAILKID